MKSFISVAVLAILLAACQKNTENPVTTSPTDQPTDPIIKSDMTSTTVTTEAALKAAVAAAKAGDIITISGTINLTSTLQLLNSGTSSSKINISGGTLNCSGMPSGSWGVKVNGSYWNVQNIHITRARDAGIVFQTGGNNYVNNITTDFCGDTGLQVYNGAFNVSVNNCHSSSNNDAANGGENADGFACKLSSGSGNKFTGCVATSNSDDGYDLYGNPYPVVITSCTANSNGSGVNGDGNGFKLGSSGQNMHHTITNSSASNNEHWGFTRNGNAKGAVIYSGLTGSGNGSGLIDL
ncbi:MAG TPA: right-handed parallel beta-helix repeat-containing protein [Chitinophagaceae bacterium]|nr:right-handed parallel beta-helix repeat-containing protein [Chitinophagaceae bacterium]